MSLLRAILVHAVNKMTSVSSRHFHKSTLYSSEISVCWEISVKQVITTEITISSLGNEILTVLRQLNEVITVGCVSI